MGLKLAMTLMPVKPPLPIDAGNQLWGYVPSLQREGLLKDHSSFPSSTEATAAQLTEHCYHQGRPRGVSPNCGYFITQGENGRKMQLVTNLL